jgi:hypothetical protein
LRGIGEKNHAVESSGVWDANSSLVLELREESEEVLVQGALGVESEDSESRRKKKREGKKNK